MSTVGTRWYTLAEAAPILGVSVDTVRRRVKRGQLEARRVHTQHGPTWEVFLGSVPTDAQADAYAPVEGAAQGADGVQDRSQAMATWAASLLVPIAAELGEARQTIERQAAQLVGKEQEIGVIREERGRLTAELERAASAVAALDDEVTAHRRRVRAVASIAAVSVALGLVVAGVAASGWVR